tara:strand:+ start:175 stop:513 length:339 start_codon:yes stop_codon:yes gene_type:complete
MEELYEFIKLISSNNFITKAKGIFIPSANVNHELLSQHRDDINSLLVQHDLALSEIKPKFEDKQVAQFTDEGEYAGLKTESSLVVVNGFEQAGGVWIAKSKSTLDAFSSALS